MAALKSYMVQRASAARVFAETVKLNIKNQSVQIKEQMEEL